MTPRTRWTRQQFMLAFVCTAGLLENGILKGPQKFYTSVAHTGEDVERTVQAFQKIAPTL